MSTHTLKTLARMADEVAALGASLGPAQTTLLYAAIRRAVAGAELSPDALNELLAECATDADREAGARLVFDLIDAQLHLLPGVLSAAMRGDRRLVDLPVDELAALVPLWIDAARQARAADREPFARLFTMLVDHGSFPQTSGIAAELRELFFTGDDKVAHIALDGLLTTGELQPNDRRFFRRLDLHLACSTLPAELSSALGVWLMGQTERWETLLTNAAQGPLRQRLRAALLLQHVGRCADLLAEDHLQQATALGQQLLADPEERVWVAAAGALALLAPHNDADALWNPGFWARTDADYLPRISAGAGVLVSVDRDWGADLVEQLTSRHAPSADDTPGDVERRVALAHACGDLLQPEPELAERVLTTLVETGCAEALATLAELIGRHHLAGGPAPDEELLRRLDRTFGNPEALTATTWQRVLAARESLVLARGGKPGTSLLLAERILARRSLEGSPPAKTLAAVRELLGHLETRIEEVDAPLFSEDTVVLGARFHGLTDLTAALFEEELLSPVLATLSVAASDEASHYLKRLSGLKAQLRALVHRHVADEERPEPWRKHALGLAALIGSAVPDDPVNRPSNSRTVGFVQLAGFPEFLRAWAADPRPDQPAAQGLGRVLASLLAQTIPGSGDVLLSLLLAAPNDDAIRSLPKLMPDVHGRTLAMRLGGILQSAPAEEDPADTRLGDLLTVVEQLCALLLDDASFTTSRLRDAVVELRRHIRTATGHERLISFMTPVRRSLEEPAEPLLVVLARDIAALHRIDAEGAEPARVVALRAVGGPDGGLTLQAEQTMSRAALDSASFEAEIVVGAEDVGDAVRRGAGAGAEDRHARADALAAAAEGLTQLSESVGRALPGCFGRLLAALLQAWSELVADRQSSTLRGPSHPLLVDRFKIEKLLGEGGMAYTYLARDPDLDRNVTLKLMKPEISRQDELRRLFTEEGKALAALPPHPHVVQAFEFLDSESAPCLVLEYVDGEALIDIVPEDGMPLKLGLDIAIAAAQGLHHVHRHQMVHLDIKSENVMVTRKGTPKLIDFGLAQRGNETRESDMILGTPCYMSPEQARGKPLDPASDVYSFGVMLYELFTGDVPFDDADPRLILKAHVSQTPEPMSMHRPGLPDGLVLLVQDMLEKVGDNRPWMVEVSSRLSRVRAALEPTEEEASELTRREIAVLCAALAGLDVDAREAVAVSRILEDFLVSANEIVNGLGGRVDATVGDRVFAVFGYPKGDAAAAHKAVRAATMMRKRIRRLDVMDVDIHAGISSGPALVGQVRGDPTDATVLGAPLEIAAYLAQEADDQLPVLVDETTFGMVRGLVETGKKRRIRGIGRAWGVAPLQE